MKESSAEARPDTLEAADIMRLLPHRYPFLLVDRVIDMDGDRSATGIKTVTANEPYFQGHFSGNPIMPGVLLIEGMAQTAGALCVSFAQDIKGAPLVYFMAIDKAQRRCAAAALSGVSGPKLSSTAPVSPRLKSVQW
jgi:3-hydroxyacyl-[acyl-carrier-protein] dehydratase